ncbi:hypothetical protein [Archangium sp.]|nr:hypothetical protein [Archangium sp.]HYO53226.1 hypothetical protein [Archangium sp.]
MSVLLPWARTGSSKEDHSPGPERKQVIEGRRADCYTGGMSITLYIKNG